MYTLEGKPIKPLDTAIASFKLGLLAATALRDLPR
jgi:hypothetical protein